MNCTNERSSLSTRMKIDIPERDATQQLSRCILAREMKPASVKAIPYLIFEKTA
jgi:hypothetical protein